MLTRGNECDLCDIEVARKPFTQSRETSLGQGVNNMLFAYACCGDLVTSNGMMSLGQKKKVLWPTHNTEIFLLRPHFVMILFHFLIYTTAFFYPQLCQEFNFGHLA